MKHTTPSQLLFILLALSVAFLVYKPGLTGGFALDDYTNIVQNAALQVDDLSWAELSRAAFSFQAGPTMRPVSMLTFTLNSYFFGLDNAMAFKITNLVIHLLNGLLVFLLLVQLLQAYRREYVPSLAENRIEWLALLTGALWLLHPLNLMPVLYVVQRETALSSLFVLVGSNVYIWGRTRRLSGLHGAWLIWTAVPLLTLVAMFSKESGALLPVYTLVIEFFIFRFRSAKGGTDMQAALFYVPMLVLPVCAALAWIIVAHGAPLDYSHRDFTLGERLMTEARIVCLYIRLTLLPDLGSMGLYHDDIAVSHGLLQPATTLCSVIALAGLVAASYLLRRRLPLVALGIAWFFGGQLMESTIFPLELAYEHRCYLPDLGLMLAVLSLIYPLQDSSRFKQPRYIFVALALCACAFLTWLRASDWQDNLTFSASEARHHPESPYATYMLGQTYANKALFEDASLYPDAVNSLKAASAVPNSSIIPDVSLILVQAQLKGITDPAVLQRIAEKLGHQRISASDIQGLNALIDCADRNNCHIPPTSMYAMFDSALTNPEIDKLAGSHANVLVIYGNYLSTQDPHQLSKARDLMAQAAALVPSEPQYQANLVTMDINMLDPALATKDLDGLRKLNYLGHLDTEIADFEGELHKLESGPHK
ncbi:MAG TPA: hypothetical protein VGO35_07255 [Gammaproteobacteria bacterium]|jgi:hypothetical protein|nr:hypothetical protein [Gammaproteobacteria bacterium]